MVAEFRDGDVRHAQCDVSATTAALGWRPTWDLERGVDALQVWIAAQLDDGPVAGA